MKHIFSESHLVYVQKVLGFHNMKINSTSFIILHKQSIYIFRSQPLLNIAVFLVLALSGASGSCNYNDFKTM